MMRKHVLIAGLMGATLLGSIPPAMAEQPGRENRRWSQDDRSNRQPPQHMRRGQEPGVTPRATGRVETQRQRIASPAPPARVVQADRDDRRNWRQDNRDDRREWRQHDRDDRREWRQNDRDDRRDWRQDRRDDRRDWRNDNRNWRDNDRHYRPTPRYNWDRDWRDNQRYNWQYHRDRYRDRYHHRYYAPRGWNYGYSRFSIGISIWSGLYASRYWIADPWYYRLPPVHGSLRWVRYYDDALLVDIRTGYVVDVIYDFFW